MADDREAALARLQLIADLLSVPVEALTAGTMPKRFWADNECMRLWHSLKTEVGRDAALDALRKIRDEEGN